MSTMTMDDVREMLGRPSLTSKSETLVQISEPSEPPKPTPEHQSALDEIEQLKAEVERLKTELASKESVIIEPFELSPSARLALDEQVNPTESENTSLKLSKVKK